MFSEINPKQSFPDLERQILEFWKKFEVSDYATNMGRIITHYTEAGVDIKMTLVSSAQMLSRIEAGRNIVSKYQDNIHKTQEEIMKKYSEIYNFILKIWKR